MIIAIDAGNSRIKWGVFGAGAWQAQGVLATSEAGRLAEVAIDWPPDALIAVCNVAGDAVAQTLRGVLGQRCAQIRWLRSSAAQCGVTNRYERPEQLGVDRWAALIGARALIGDACLVVCAGTATTIDLLDAEGVFQGGVILPGYDLMRQSLAQNTAQLPLAAGHFSEQPRNTMDAIVSGCLLAQAGAIERLYRQLPAGATCLLTGGAAPLLAGQLALPVRRVENLVLQGLLRFAHEAGGE
jgi:type III pantothenate kinase